jgi:hypothetical protein
VLVEQKKTCKWLSEELGVNPSTVSKWCTNSGHKDGAVFTPGFVTMYMAHEAVRRTIIQKFNNTYKEWNCQTEIDLYNRLSHIDVKEANSVFNSIKICDPAVGSGHFLVSVLNELVCAKYDFGILADKDGRYVNKYHYRVEIESDELIVFRYG